MPVFAAIGGARGLCTEVAVVGTRVFNIGVDVLYRSRLLIDNVDIECKAMAELYK